ncbi:MAG: hypothetical protein ACP6IS_02910 [Candidatus Asgardarchaeia archaeon]
MTYKGDSSELSLDEELAELVAVLSTRWRDENGILRIGVDESRLKEALGVKNRDELSDKLSKLQRKLTPLGLEITRYFFDKKFYFCIRTIYGVPSELSDIEYALLGVIIYYIETSGSDFVTRKQLEISLVDGHYMNLYQLEQSLKTLELFGYIVKRRGNVAYGPRTLIEFEEDRRRAIAEEVKAWLI